MVRCGRVRFGLVRQGEANLNLSFQGKVWLGKVRRGSVR